MPDSNECSLIKSLERSCWKRLWKKLVSTGHRPQIAESFVKQGKCSERVACRHFGLRRSTFKYEAKERIHWKFLCEVQARVLRSWAALDHNLGSGSGWRLNVEAQLFSTISIVGLHHSKTIRSERDRFHSHWRFRLRSAIGLPAPEPWLPIQLEPLIRIHSRWLYT